MGYLRLTNLADLRIGLFIKIKGSWFSHPFSVSMFKITTKGEIETLRGLKRPVLFYDPDRSDPDPNADKEFEDGTDADNSQALLEGLPEVDAEFIFEEEALGGAQPDESTEELVASPLQEDVTVYQKQRSRLFQEEIQNLKKIENTYSTVLRESEKIFNDLVGQNPAGVGCAHRVVSDLAGVLSQQSVSMTLMDVLGQNGLGWGLSTHSLNVSILSLLIARELKVDSNLLQPLGLGGLFHDIGERLVPMRVKFGEAGMKMESDPELRKLHPEKGHEWMQKFPEISPKALEVILQHHERLNGTGFPKALQGEEISLLAQIVMVADDYDEMCNAANAANRRTPHEALGKIYRSFLGTESHKYSEDVVQALVRALTVYPPGTFIQLSDESFGLVTSINSQNPLKPLVMVYCPKEGNHGLKMVDLVTEEKLEVKKVLRPNELPPKVQERLSRRHVAVFLHAADEITQSQQG